MNPTLDQTLNPTPLEILRNKKGWRLNRVHQELKKRGTPISYPTLLRIEHGYRSVIVRDKITKEILKEKKMPYKPRPGYLMILAKLFRVADENSIYEDRSKK